MWLGVYAAGFAVIYALFTVTLLTPPPYPYGALARIGHVSEHALGWRAIPPPIAPGDLSSSPLSDADVVVIGDSFSMYHAWQSPLVAAGLRVATAHWDKVGPLCSNLGQWLQAQGFRGRVVVLESVERLLPERLQATRHCEPMTRPFKPMPPIGASPSQPPPKPALNWDAKLLTGYYTWRNTRQLAAANGPVTLPSTDHGDMVFGAPLPDGCTQFSNRMCERGLFLDDDRTNGPLSADDAQQMLQIARQAEPFKVIWMVAPDKTTVYLDPQHARAFVQRSNALGLGPDLFGLAQQLRHRIIDLYWPDDTHWSMQGQLAFGERMLAAVRAAVAPPDKQTAGGT